MNDFRLFAPTSRRRRVRIVGTTVIDLIGIEVAVRRVSLDRLCAARGITFVGFRPVEQEFKPLPRSVGETLWGVDLVLRWWPWGRGRPCLRRGLAIGKRTAALHPSLCLEVVRPDPLLVHAVLATHGQRLDLGSTGPDAQRRRP